MTTDPKLHVTTIVVPPPELVQAGVKEERYTKLVGSSVVGQEIATLVQEITDSTDILAQRGTIVVMIQAHHVRGTKQ